MARRQRIGGATVDGVLDDVRAGDVLRIWATLPAPEGPQNPGEPDFAALERRQRRLCRFMWGIPTVSFAWGPSVGRV